MDRTLVLAASAPIPVGHRVEVVEQSESADGAAVVVAITDLDTGVRFQRAEEPTGPLAVWQGRVLTTTVTTTADGPRTAVRLDAVRVAAEQADTALRGADAAASAAKNEAERWGSDPFPDREPDRIW